MAKDMTPDTGQKRSTTGLLVTYTHSTGEEDITPHAGPHRACALEQNEPQRAVRSRLLSCQQGECPLILEGEYDWLV